MPLPEKMSVYELAEEIKKEPDNQWLRDMLERKLRLLNRADYKDLNLLTKYEKI